MNATCVRNFCLTGLLAGGLVGSLAWGEANAADPEWTSPHRYRILLAVDARGRTRSHSPAALEMNFQSLVGSGELFDEHTVEVVALDPTGRPKIYDDSQPGTQRSLVPHRLDRLFGSDKLILHFVMPNHLCTRYAVYFDTTRSGIGNPRRYPGLVGDGDRFCEGFQRREINASHFDQFVDFDADGDLDLFQGGVEPFVYCYENMGGNRLEARGRLSSDGKLLVLPCSKDNRSWLTVAFHDVDGDGDQDFLPSFGDGPDAGRIVLYRNTTEGRAETLTFERVGPLKTVSGELLAGGAQRGGWFPSISLVSDWDGEPRGRLDAIVGSNHRCWLYRGLGEDADGTPRFAEAEALRAGGEEIHLVNPRFDVADIDSDGDLDLFAGTQPGPIWHFENSGNRHSPALAAGRIIALDGNFLIGDAHSGIKVADFDGDGLLDLVAGRFWERTDLNHPEGPREFGGLLRNVGSPKQPKFEHSTRGAPFTERFQLCDAVRQNAVRAADWDRDGRMDLLAGDTDGFIWWFRNQSSQLLPLFSPGEKLRAGGQPLSVAGNGGHARCDVCDWDNDGILDVVVADGRGALSVFRSRGKGVPTSLAAAEKVHADGKPIQGAARASVLVCDWDHDGRQDVVFADERGYYWHRNIGTDAAPRLAAAAAIQFAGRTVSYVRPNLGSLVDWDGDGKQDFLGCHFENSVRWYRNTGPDTPGSEPQFDDPEGIVILQASSPQMISGVHAVDWNGDGDIDLLTGQGHGGSGLRFFERDWLEDQRHGTHPRVTVDRLQTRSD